MEKLKLAWLEMRRTSWRLSFVLLFVVTWWIVLPKMSNPAPLWSDAIKAIQLSLIVTAPLLAGIAAWVAMREEQSGISELLRTTALPASIRWTMIWLAMLFLGVCLLTMLFVAFSIWLNWRGAWLEPILGLIFDSYLALMAYISVGFVIGLWLPTRFTPLLTIALTFLVMQLLLTLPYIFPKAFVSLPGLANLSPFAASYVWYYTPFYAVNSYLLYHHLLWLAGITSCCLFLILLRERFDLKWGIGVLCSASFSMMILLLLLKIPSHGQPSPHYLPYQALCHQGRIEVCIHPAYAPLLPDMAALIERVLMPLAEVPESPKRAEQHDGFMPNGKILNNPLYLPNGTLAFGAINYNRAADVAGNQNAYFAWQLAWALVQDQNKIGAHSVTEAQAVVATWLVQQAGYALVQPYGVISAEGEELGILESERFIEDATLRFSQLPSSVRQEWLKANFGTLRQSTLTLHDLP